jgi:ABC-2 type transport system ATP-binding protein
MPLIEAVDLHKRFGETKALDGLSLSVNAGEVLAVLGPNGAGKTTAVRVLTTLIKPDQGTATIDGIDVTTEPGRVRSRIGLTGQYAAVDERLSARENLELVGRFFRMPTAQSRIRATELLKTFDLEEAADRVVKGFSGGMRRRIDIAMSLVARPQVLFLDEPTTGLDPVSRQVMWGLIQELVNQGTTTLLTTQYLDEADLLADRISVVDHGRVVAEGTSDSLKAKLGGYVATIVIGEAGQIENATTALIALASEGTEITINGSTLTMSVGATVSTPQIIRLLDTVGAYPTDVHIEPPSLDDVFFALTGHREGQ